MGINLSGGQIWKANNDVLCFKARDKKLRRVIVNKNELCEFRYSHDAHFRIDDDGQDVYLYLDEKDFRENFTFVGNVFEPVRFRNQNSMKQIIESRLYEEK